MSDADELERLVPAWLTLPDVAEALGVEVTRVRQLVKEGALAAVRRGERRVLQVPAAFVQDGQVLKGLQGTLTVLGDAGYTTEESLRWLFTPQDDLPGSPVDALVADRKTEVRRRAQALAF
ncbi:Rv2175c family DNA-binding protein [Vallicoccus soli]|uniref:DNA-binding protein n=1 Tax=Vallicoccus soli TaxID=2339232 RepID=A0A3A3Z7P1_9ACTN|nr:Rv2175c family DNA-binding protein [Vallicoccus soli]RJK96857.1 DNA-binding protein [Vallicoccus soli]